MEWNVCATSAWQVLRNAASTTLVNSRLHFRTSIMNDLHPLLGSYLYHILCGLVDNIDGAKCCMRAVVHCFETVIQSLPFVNGLKSALAHGRRYKLHALPSSKHHGRSNNRIAYSHGIEGAEDGIVDRFIDISGAVRRDVRTLQSVMMFSRAHDNSIGLLLNYLRRMECIPVLTNLTVRLMLKLVLKKADQPMMIMSSIFALCAVLLLIATKARATKTPAILEPPRSIETSSTAYPS